MAEPGIRYAIYLGGLPITRGPASVTPTWLKAQTRDRARDGSLYVDSLQSSDAAPLIMAKMDLSLAWDTLCDADIAAINGLISYGGPVDVCIWQYVTESFYVPSGSSYAGSLSRRNALTTISPLPTGAAADYPVAATKGGSTLSVTLGTPDSTAGVTPWTATGTSSGERVTIRYCPVYRMYTAESQESFAIPHRQGQTLRLEEM